jgi:hypothetical protein
MPTRAGRLQKLERLPNWASASSTMTAMGLMAFEVSRRTSSMAVRKQSAYNEGVEMAELTMDGHLP